MKSLIKHLLVVLIVSLTQKAIAQSFPVNINPVIHSPYSPYLSDYIEPGSQKLLVNILLKDPTLPEYPCKFRLTIEGVGITIRTRQSFIPQPTILQGGGIPNILYGEDLAEYFNPANLDFAGISKGDYTKSAKLPEGIYRFSFEVLDYNRGTTVSNKGFATAWIILNDPVLLNLPRNEAKVKILDPTNIAFTWTPRHTGSPNSAFTTEYIFKLIELWPATRNPYDAFLSQQPLYETITNATQIVYGPAEPALIPGRKYAWQVQAKDTDGKDLFKNEGKSEVYIFQYGDALGIPENLRQEHSIGNSSALILRWQPAGDGAAPEQYRLRYRKKGTEASGIWYEEVTDQVWERITDLQPDTEYEIQIRSEAKPQYSDYSPSAYFRTEKKSAPRYECGKEDTYIPSGNTNPLKALVPGDTISMRDFKIRVEEVTGGNGNYRGKGWMQVQWFNGAWVHISFSGPVNELHEMYGGSVESIYTRGGKTEQLLEKAHRIGEKPVAQTKSTDSTTIAVAPDYTIKGTLDSVYIEEGKIIAVDAEGNKSTYDQKKDERTGKVKDTVIADAAGNGYTVGEDGKVTKKAGTAATQSGSTIASLSIKDRLVVAILEQFEEEMAAWLRNNGKGGDIDDDLLLATELPACFKRDAGQLTYLKDKIIPYYKEHPAELVAKIETDKHNRKLFDKATSRFNNTDEFDWSKIPAGEQAGSRNATGIALVNRIAPLVEFYEKAAPILAQKDYEEAVKKIQAIYKFFKTCSSEGWDSYQDEGIIPYCFWRDQNVPAAAYYSNADIPFLAGLIDGGYREADGLYRLPQLIKDISKIPGEVFYAYTAAYLNCSPANLVASAEQLDYVLTQLAENENENGIFEGLINGVDNWVNDNEGKKQKLLAYFSKCENARELREEIDQLYTIATNWEEIQELSVQVLQHLKEYGNTLQTADNIGRYERGRLVVPVVSTALTLGGTAATKIDEIKNVLKSLRTASEGSWKKVTEGIGKLLTKGTDDVLEEINRIKNLRKTDLAKRIEELGKDLDKGRTSLIEGKAGVEIEETYGYFERFKSTQEKKGDWISLSGKYKGKTFDEIGGELGKNAINQFALKPKEKRMFFLAIDKHFLKADFVVLNLTEMKRLQPSLYKEALEYISKKYGNSKLINITK